jgi:hypothetical protein
MVPPQTRSDTPTPDEGGLTSRTWVASRRAACKQTLLCQENTHQAPESSSPHSHTPNRRRSVTHHKDRKQPKQEEGTPTCPKRTELPQAPDTTTSRNDSTARTTTSTCPLEKMGRYYVRCHSPPHTTDYSQKNPSTSPRGQASESSEPRSRCMNRVRPTVRRPSRRSHLTGPT